MTFHMRQDVRNITNRAAWISAGDDLPLLKCKLIDLSDSGAKLELEDIDGIPDEFSLWLSRRGHPRHSCRLVWRRQDTIGVQFSSVSDKQLELSANR